MLRVVAMEHIPRLVTELSSMNEMDAAADLRRLEARLKERRK